MKIGSARTAVIALTLLVTSGCATTEYVEVRPECTVPPQPALPQIDGSELQSLSDDTYWKLERREKRLTDWTMEMRAMLRELCKGGE